MLASVRAGASPSFSKAFHLPYHLTLTVGADLLDQFPDGVWLVGLSALTDPGLVTQAVATVLDLDERADQCLSDTMVDCLRGKHLVLILDNREHLSRRMLNWQMHCCGCVARFACLRPVERGR